MAGHLSLVYLEGFYSTFAVNGLLGVCSFPTMSTLKLLVHWGWLPLFLFFVCLETGSHVSQQRFCGGMTLSPPWSSSPHLPCAGVTGLYRHLQCLIMLCASVMLSNLPSIIFGEKLTNIYIFLQYAAIHSSLTSLCLLECSCFYLD